MLETGAITVVLAFVFFTCGSTQDRLQSWLWSFSLLVLGMPVLALSLSLTSKNWGSVDVILTIATALFAVWTVATAVLEIAEQWASLQKERMELADEKRIRAR